MYFNYNYVQCSGTPLYTFLTERCTLLMCDYVKNAFCYYSEQCVAI